MKSTMGGGGQKACSQCTYGREKGEKKLDGIHRRSGAKKLNAKKRLFGERNVGDFSPNDCQMTPIVHPPQHAFPPCSQAKLNCNCPGKLKRRGEGTEEGNICIEFVPWRGLPSSPLLVAPGRRSKGMSDGAKPLSCMSVRVSSFEGRRPVI